jgi:acyl-CoA dehydrogenase family protein 9
MIFPFPETPRDERENVALMLDSIRRFFTANVDSAEDRSRARDPRACSPASRSWASSASRSPGARRHRPLDALVPARHAGDRGRDTSIAVTLGAHQSIGLKALLLFGTPELKQRYLPAPRDGEKVAAFALTEPGAGSDAAGHQDPRRALRPDGAHYLLNGSKIWITNGGFADVFTVFARTSPDEEGKPSPRSPRSSSSAAPASPPAPTSTSSASAAPRRRRCSSRT